MDETIDLRIGPRELPIVEVTVFEDRARVRRRGIVPLTGERTHVELSDVAVVIVDRTLVGWTRRPTGSDLGSRREIPSIRVVRRLVHEPRDSPDALSEAEMRLEQARDRVADLRARIEELEAFVGSLAAIGRLAIVDTVTDAAFGLGDEAARIERFAAIDRELAAAREERLRIEDELDDAQQELAALERDFAVRCAPTSRARASLRFVVLAEPGQDRAEVEIVYVVANACWRPLHRAELSVAPSSPRGQLIVRTDACVWQNTGEDWPEAKLTFSTERSSRPASAPKLATDRLAVRLRGAATIVASRQVAVASTGPGVAASSDGLPGIDDGGQPRRAEARRPTRVPSDGRPHRTTIGSFETEAELALVAYPELVPVVLRRSVQVNASPHPLLAGPVELVRDGGFVGRTTIRFVAPGERFELGWGPEGALRLDREETVRTGHPSLLSTARVTLVDRTLRISSLAAIPLTLEIVERIPVSELEKVRILLDPRRSWPGARADEDGMVRLRTTVEAGGRVLVTLGFEVRAAHDVQGLPY